MFRFTIRELVLLTLVAAIGDSNTVQADPPSKLPAPQKAESKTIETSCGGVRFTLNLPVTWEWADYKKDEASASRHQSDLRRFIGTLRETFIRLDRHEVCDTDSAAVAARKRLADLPDEKMLNARVEKGWQVTVHDQRIIEIDGTDAVWQATSSEPLNSLPETLEYVCYVRWDGVDFRIRGRYFDNRRERTAKDFEKSRADVLAIIQSFRLKEPLEEAVVK